ncbi:hypothetical protein T8T21_05650 [Limimaricola variabilis]|uniref:hypothetical protein n=1 Tax=Limimaricola variabilis TaxID=1492771 RepID=UPI002AC902F0|nr:hypothetical protein [Limimaricola variabilis]WPY95607.1 hypothetical protein T8T21_05650 [Limimaricola variabilis]
MSAPEFPTSGWTLSLALRGPASIDVSATGEGENHHLSADAATTAGWAPGTYWYQIRATDDVDVQLVEEGQVRILEDLAAAGPGFDGRSHAEKVLAAIEAVIEGRASLDQSEYRINNRSLTRTPVSDLLKLRNQYRAEVRAQRMARRGRGSARRHLVRF